MEKTGVLRAQSSAFVRAGRILICIYDPHCNDTKRTKSSFKHLGFKHLLSGSLHAARINRWIRQAGSLPALLRAVHRPHGGCRSYWTQTDTVSEGNPSAPKPY